MDDRNDVRSPDVFADNNGEDEDSFDAFDIQTITNTRKRSEPLVLQGEEDPIMTMLDEASDDDDDDDEESRQVGGEDALSRVLRSFRESTHEPDSDAMSDKSVDLFEDALLPVELPSGSRRSPPSKRRREEPEEPEPEPGCSSSRRTGPNPIEPDYWQMNQKNVFVVNGEAHEINTFGDYMNMKISKLNYQVNEEKSKPFEKISDIFQGYSVFVNGFTDPPALVIRDLMLAHGGEYHCYYIHGKTSYVIATSIAQAKMDRLREKEIYITADWITESIAAGKVIDYHQFLLYEKGANEKGGMEKFLKKKHLDARDPNFIKEYYAQSRLHLISTLAQDMKDFVAQLKIKGAPEKKEHINNMHDNEEESLIFHIDLDCFFVSVALRNRPELVGEPVAIAHSRGGASSMSEIASCSYAARNVGVKNGMLVKTALRSCPRLMVLPYQFDDYIDVSKKIYEILASFTLDIRAVSCDEMYINATNLCDNTNPLQLAETIRQTIQSATQCTASIGIGPTSLIARLATRHAKPDGVHWVQRGEIRQFMANERIANLPGIGYQMMDRMSQMFGEQTMSHLQSRSEKELAQVFGPKQAAKIWKQCRGEEEDAPEFWETQLRKSVSCDINYGIRFSKKEDLAQLMRAISNEIEQKLTQCQMMAGSVTLKLMIRAPNAPLETAKFMGHGHCDTYTKTANLSCATLRADAIYAESMRLYQRIPQAAKLADLRGVGVTCGKLRCRMRKEAAEAVREMFRNVKPARGAADDEPGPSTSGARRNRRLEGFLELTQLQIRRFQWRRRADHRRPFNYMQLLKNEPTRDTVTQISKYFENLMRSGRFQELGDKFRDFMAAAEDSSKSHESWFYASHAILQKVGDESQKFYRSRVDFLTDTKGDAAEFEAIEKRRMRRRNNCRMVEIRVEPTNTSI